MKKLEGYVKLIRPYGILFLGTTPVFGAISNGGFSFPHLFILFAIGAFFHIYGFVQNDYFDREVDRQSKFVSQRPLVLGVVSGKEAFVIFLFSFLISIILTVLFVFTPLSFFVLLLSFILMSLYNKYSKKIPGMEYVLGAGVFTLGLFGALTVKNTISFLVIIIGLVELMQWLFSVGVSANLKDVPYDLALGVKTTPMILGVTAIKNRLQVPLIFWGYAFGIKSIHILLASLPFILGYTSLFLYGLPIPGSIFIFISLLLIFTTRKILSTPLSRRDKLLVHEGLHEGLSILIIPISLLSYIVENTGLIMGFSLLLLLILWPLLSLRVLFGRKMIPLE
jgi:4-hydroxybenzoate polyprenyltransferase